MQKSFSDLEYAAKKKLTRRDLFLAEIESVTPWSMLHKLVGLCRIGERQADSSGRYMASVYAGRTSPASA